MTRLLASIAVALILAPSSIAGAALDQRAQMLLELADTRRAAGNTAGALAAYLEAVQIYPAVASLEAIRSYAPPLDSIDENARTLHVSALRHYLRLNPDDFDAKWALERAIAELDVARRIGIGPDVAQGYRDRAMLRAQQGELAAAVQDAEKAAELAPKDADISYFLCVVINRAITRQSFPAAEARNLARRGIEAAQRAGALRADYSGALLCESSLLREEAKLESDRALRESLIGRADALRERANAISPPPPSAPPRPPAPSQRAERPPRVTAGVEAPVVLSRVDPVYPGPAWKAQISGIVILDVVIDEKGEVGEVVVLKGLPLGLSEAAVEAVKQWKFEPATRNGVPVTVLFTVSVGMQPPTN